VKKIGIIIQARMGSSRLPGKVLKQVSGKSLLEYLFDRLAQAKKCKTIILATTINPEDDKLCDKAEAYGIPVYRGSEDDVLDRYYQAAKQYNLDPVIRITADCPLILPELIDMACVAFYNENIPDYLGFKLPYPEGLADIAVFPFSALEKAWNGAEKMSEREHVTKFLINRPDRFRLVRLDVNSVINEFRYTIDEDLDYEVVKQIIEDFHPANDFNLKDLEEYSLNHPEVVNRNKHIMRNEGYYISLQKDGKLGSRT